MILFILSDYPFMPNVRVSADPGPTLNQGESSFAVSSSGDSIFVACNTNERGSYAALPFAASYNGGSTFPTNYNFVDNSVGITWHTDPVVGVDDSGYVHLLVQFSTYVIRHYLSRDGGHTWFDTSNVSDPSTGGDVDKPWMVVKGDTVYVAWQEFGGTESGLRFARSYDRGRTWWRTTFNFNTGLVAMDVADDGTISLRFGVLRILQEVHGSRHILDHFQKVRLRFLLLRLRRSRPHKLNSRLWKRHHLRNLGGQS